MKKIICLLFIMVAILLNSCADKSNIEKEIFFIKNNKVIQRKEYFFNDNNLIIENNVFTKE